LPREAMNVPGNSAFYHDTAACLVHDGKIIAVTQKERFSLKSTMPLFRGMR
jgi:carbamoyltransferase